MRLVGGLMVILGCCVSALLADNMVFDRGLPVANLNNAAGSNRSNVAWGDYTPASGYNWTMGDDFSFGASGQSYHVTDLRVWIIGNSSGDPLSSIFSSLTLAGGLPGTTPISGGACLSSNITGLSQGFPCLSANGISTISTVNTTGDPNVSIAAVKYANGQDYQGSSGNMDTLYQVDFQNLNWVVQGNTTYSFFVLGTPTVGGVGNGGVSPFLAASNATLGGSPHDGSDNRMWEVAQDASTSTYSAMDQWNSGALGGGWDKSSDINVQIFATPEPTSILFLGTVMLVIGPLARRRYQQRRQL